MGPKTEAFRSLLRNLREEIGTRDEFRKQFGISQGSQKDYENRGLLPRLRHLEALSMGTGYNLDALVRMHKEVAQEQGKLPLDHEASGVHEKLAEYRLNRDSDKLRVFISHAHQDASAAQDLKDHLVNLVQEGLIEMLPEEPQNDAEQQTESSETTFYETDYQADVVIVLLSQSYIAASYRQPSDASISNGQFPGTLLLTLLKNCDYQHWQVLPEGLRSAGLQANQPIQIGNTEYQWLPVNQQGEIEAINRWPFPEDAYGQIADRLRELARM